MGSYPNPEKVRMEDRGEYLKMIAFMKKFTPAERASIRQRELASLAWDWPPEFGPAPAGWEQMPNYRKPGMPENVRTRADYLDIYFLWL